MIIDSLHRLPMYTSVASRLSAAAQWAAATDLDALPAGKHVIDGDHLFANAMSYDTRPEEKSVWEAHRKYIDVQIILAGSERIAVQDVEEMTETTPFDAGKDVAFFSGQGDYITLSTGQFAIFFPHDVHRPCVHPAAGMAAVKKVVIKVEVDG